MAYEPTTWQLGLAGGTAINPTRLNKLEQGVADAHTLIAGLSGAAHTHVSADITDATSANTVSTIVKRDATGSIAVTAVSGLSTATGSTQAVPKTQLDAAISAEATSRASADTALDGRLTTAEADIDALQAADVALDARLDTAEADILTKADDGHTHSVGYADLPADSVLIVQKSAGVWPSRPTSRTDIKVGWMGADPSPAVVASGTAGMIDGVDFRLVTT